MKTEKIQPDPGKQYPQQPTSSKNVSLPASSFAVVLKEAIRRHDPTQWPKTNKTLKEKKSALNPELMHERRLWLKKLL